MCARTTLIHTRLILPMRITGQIDQIYRSGVCCVRNTGNTEYTIHKSSCTYKLMTPDAVTITAFCVTFNAISFRISMIKGTRELLQISTSITFPCDAANNVCSFRLVCRPHSNSNIRQFSFAKSEFFAFAFRWIRGRCHAACPKMAYIAVIKSMRWWIISFTMRQPKNQFRFRRQKVLILNAMCDWIQLRYRTLASKIRSECDAPRTFRYVAKSFRE